MVANKVLRQPAHFSGAIGEPERFEESSQVLIDRLAEMVD